MSWTLDFFGRNRAAIAAASSEAEASRLDAAAARLFLTTAVASTYNELARLVALRKAATASLDVRRGTLDLVARRLAQGLANGPERDRAAALVLAAEGEVLALDRRIASERLAIAALVGAGSDRAITLSDPAVVGGLATGVPSTLPLDLGGRRPDLLAALARVEAADRRIDAARRDFLPNVNLLALVGVQSFGIADLFTRDALAGSAGPAVRLPIFSGGRLRANLHQAAAGHDEAVADILSSQRVLQRQVEAAERAGAPADTASRGMRHRYAGGLASYLEVLTAEGAVSARRELADVRAQSLLLDVALTYTMIGQMAADALGLLPDSVRVAIGDTLLPPGPVGDAEFVGWWRPAMLVIRPSGLATTTGCTMFRVTEPHGSSSADWMAFSAILRGVGCSRCFGIDAS